MLATRSRFERCNVAWIVADRRGRSGHDIISVSIPLSIPLRYFIGLHGNFSIHDRTALASNRRKSVVFQVAKDIEWPILFTHARTIGLPYRRGLFPRCGTLILLSSLIGLACTSAAASEPLKRGEPSVISEPPISEQQISEQQARESVQWLVNAAIKYVPAVFNGEKNWGDTRRVWAGVRTRLDGLKLKTHRRYRELDHGRWIQYEIVLPKVASPPSPLVMVHRVTRTENSRWRIDATTETPMHFTARVQRWNYGVKLYSVTVSGKMRVRLNLVSTIGFDVDYLQLPPVLVVDPIIEKANLELVGFEVERVSHIGGDAAEAWGEMMQELIVERFVEKQNDKIVMKLNKAIDKHRDELRFGWQNMVKSR